MAYDKAKLDGIILFTRKKLNTHDEKYSGIIKAWKVAKKPLDTASQKDKDFMNKFANKKNIGNVYNVYYGLNNEYFQLLVYLYYHQKTSYFF